VTAARWAGFVVGLFVVLGTAVSVVFTLVVPRAVGSRLAVANRMAWRAISHWAAERVEDYYAKDRILAATGPMALLSLFGLWLAVFVVGYALILWPLTGHGFLEGLRQVGSSIPTLGTASSPRAAVTAVDDLAAATGLVVVALEIAYLPTIYAAFNRRETLVTMLESRAGAPAWGPEILARHQLVGIMNSLPDFYATWEQWAADLAESHTNYPALVLFRSPNPLRSWIVALTAVLDSAALYLSLSPASAPSQARLCLRMGFVSLRDIARSWRIPFDPDPLPDAPLRLTYEEFLVGVERMAEAGFTPERPAEEAWAHFRGWRVNYEAIVYELANRIYAAPGPWSGPRHNIGSIEPRRPLDRTPDDPEAVRRGGGRWRGPRTPTLPPS